MLIIGEFLTPIIQAALVRRKDNQRTDDVEGKSSSTHHVLLDQLVEVSDGEYRCNVEIVYLTHILRSQANC